MADLWTRLRSAALRVSNAWRGWGAAAVLVVLLSWALRLPWPTTDAEQRLSFFGMLLQLMGVGTVFVGIGQTRKRLKKPPVLRGIWDHLAGLFKEPQVTRVITGTAAIHMGGGTLTASGTHAPTTRSLEDRVKRLEDELNAHVARLTELGNKIRDEASAREQAIGAEQTARTEADGELRQVLDDVQTGGVELTVAGLLWLVFGIILTSIPQWLAYFAVGS